MFDRYRIYIAHFVAPLIGLVMIFTIWLLPDSLCSTRTECFSLMPASVILIVTYLLYAGMFLTGITQKARDLYGEIGLPFWRLALASVHRGLFAAILFTSILLFARWPGTTNGWADSILALLLPPLSVFVLYSSWYIIVGRENQQIKVDAQKERSFAA